MKQNSTNEFLSKETKQSLINNIEKGDVIQMLKYFANSKSELVEITDIYTDGVELTYNDGGVIKDIFIAFERKVKDLGLAKKELMKLKREASSVLNMNVDKSYIPPGRETGEIILFTNPSLKTYLATTLFWAVLYYISDLERLPTTIRMHILTIFDQDPTAIMNIGISLVIINIGLSAVVLLMGLNAEFPLDILVKWIGLTLFFGFATAGPFVKLAYKRREKLDADDPIG